MADLDDHDADEAADETADALAERRTLDVPATAQGERLDRFLAGHVEGFSRSYLAQLIEEGLVRRNGQVCAKPSTRLSVADRLEVELRPTAQSQAFVPQDIALRVLYEDAHLVLIDKPAGLVVHPAPGNWSGTLLNALLHRYPDAASLPRAGIVHRLDKDTSGVMVVARNRQTMDALVRLIAAREVHREYWALAHGVWSAPSGSWRPVDAPIGRDPRQRLRMAVVDVQRHPGKPARTDVAAVGSSAEARASWLHCRLHTGRTHQIRVHLQSLGHPLIADSLYGGAPALGMQRQALHAFRLSFTHPATGAPIQCDAPMPADMQAAVQAMGLA